MVLVLAALASQGSTAFARDPVVTRTPLARAPAASLGAPEALSLTPRQFLVQGVERAKLLVGRAVTFPAFVWPFNRLMQAVAHGEPFTGLTPASAVRVGRRVVDQGSEGVVIGRLAPTLRDIWSVRGAERSFLKLIDELAAARAKDPRLKAAVAYDPDSLGLGLSGFSRERREQVAMAGMLRVARHAKARGVPLELDMTGSETMPFTLKVAEQIVTEVGIPVRLAIAARYEASMPALRNWAALATRTGQKLGVRLVKGSYVEADTAGIINQRGPLMRHYRELVTQALRYGDVLDVAVATQNEEIWQHARAEARRLGTTYRLHVIRGVNAPFQAKVRAAGETIGGEYVSYGADAPIFGLQEALENRQAKKTLIQRFAQELN